MNPSYGSPFPNHAQELLLKACVFSGEEMLSAFAEWKQLVDFETDIDHGSFRQLPLLYHNLNKHGVNDSMMPRLKGIYRQAWSKNQMLFHKTGMVLQLLSSSKIPSIVLKGIALSILSYKNYAVRPMSDMDIMVPAPLANVSFEFLKVNSWQSLDAIHDRYNLTNNKSITLVNKENSELDLHWYPFDECMGLMHENDFWDKAVPMEVSGQKALALCPADELLLTLVHGLMPNPEPPIRWIADALSIINADDVVVDWNRLIEYAKKFSVIIQVKEALQYLTETFHANVPSDAYQTIMAIRPTFADKLVYRKKGVFVYHPSFKKIFTTYITFLKDPARKGMIRKHIGFIQFARARSKGKPHFKILLHYISVLRKGKRKSHNF